MAWDSLFSLFSITLSLCPYVFRLFRVYLYLVGALVAFTYFTY